MSGSGPEGVRPNEAAGNGLQEAEQDWAAAKAFYENLVSKRPRPVSAEGRGLEVRGLRPGANPLSLRSPSPSMPSP